MGRMVNMSALGLRVPASRLNMINSWPSYCIGCHVTKPAKEHLLFRCGCIYCIPCWRRVLEEGRLFSRDAGLNEQFVLRCFDHHQGLKASSLPASGAKAAELFAIEKWKLLLKMSNGTVESIENEAKATELLLCCKCKTIIPDTLATCICSKRHKICQSCLKE